MLIKDWKKHLRYALSIRFHIISVLFSFLEFALPYINEWYEVPRGVFLGLALFSQAGGMFFKFYSQKEFRNDET